MTETGAVTASDIAQTNPRLGQKTQKRKKLSKGEKDMDTIQETDGYRFYNSGDRKVFEFLKTEDFPNIQLGFKKRNFRYFRESESGRDLLEALLTHKGKNVVVKCGDFEWKPFVLGF
jgi:hypothetical protein